MKRTLLRFGWVRSIGATLMLAGVAVVFVVVILPTTAFGSSKAVKGGCKVKFKSFSIAKADRLENSGQEESGTIAIFGSNLDRVDDVQFLGVDGSKIDYLSASDFTFVSPGGYLHAEASEDSLGVPGRIRIVDFDVTPYCYSYSKSQYTPAHTS